MGGKRRTAKTLSLSKGGKCYGATQSWGRSVREGSCNITQDGQRKPFEEGERRLKGSYRVSHRDKEEKQREQVQGQCGDGLAGLFQE